MSIKMFIRTKPTAGEVHVYQKLLSSFLPYNFHFLLHKQIYILSLGYYDLALFSFHLEPLYVVS